MRQQPKILYLVTEDWYFCSHRLQLAAAARRAGYDVVVATNLNRHEARIRAEGIRPIPFGMARAGLNPLRDFATLLQLIGLYRTERPDLVHHVAMKPVLYGAIAARAAGVSRRVHALAGLGYLFSSPDARARGLRLPVSALLHWLLKGDRSRVILQNADDRELFIRELSLVPAQIRLIRGSGVDPDVFLPTPEPQGTPVVMLASRMLRDKGVREFAEAARCCKTRGVEARFVLVGDPDPQNPSSISRAELEAWHSSGILEWWGAREDMAAVLSQAHVVCLPSYREGLPKVLLEAAACGRPIITTDTPGCREIVRQGENGYLVPVRAVTELADAVERLVGDTVLRKSMGRAGRRRVEEEFCLERVVSETLRVYEELFRR